MPGLTNSDVTFGPNFIEVNLQGLQVRGTFTLDLIPSTATPEPGTLALLGTALAALIGLRAARRKNMKPSLECGE